MKKVTLKAVEKLVKENNIFGKIYMDFSNNIYTIFSENGSVSFENSLTAGKVFRFLKFELSFKTSENIMDQDEFEGLCQANKLGLKTYECTILA